MRIGLSISGRTPDATRAVARLADDAGIDMVGLGDSQSTLRDVYALLSVCAAATSRLALGPLVTNPMTRHPAVTAAAITTIDELSGGRAFLGIGRGNASVVNAGLPRATTADLRHALDTIRRAMPAISGAAREARTLPWATRPVPLLVHTGGPATLRVAAEGGDGLIFRWGDSDPARLAEYVRAIRAARARTPRASEPFELWTMVTVCVTDAPERARETIDVAHRARSLPAREIPPDLADRMRAFRDRYRFEHHASKTNKVNQKLLAEVGLTEFTLDRYALIGDAPEVAARLRDAATAGVDGAILAIDDAPEMRADDETRVGAAAAVRDALRAMDRTGTRASG
jgi:5,10-methylenetetrahydromethanopterin reductase